MSTLEEVMDRCEQLESFLLLGNALFPFCLSKNLLLTLCASFLAFFLVWNEGLVNFHVALWLRNIGQRKAHVGYARAAYIAYNSLKAFALARMVIERFPLAFDELKPKSKAAFLPSECFHKLLSPQSPRSPAPPPPLVSSDSTVTNAYSNSTATGSSLDFLASNAQQRPWPTEETNIDHLTFVRSSLVIAAEKVSLFWFEY